VTGAAPVDTLGELTPQHSSSARAALTVFLLSGMLMSLLGTVLPAWEYHLRGDPIEIGHYFLAMAAGIICSARIGEWILRRRPVRFLVVFGSGLASAGLVELAVASPPVDWGWRALGVFLIGTAAGILNSAAFRSISSIYERDPAATVNMAGVMFGLGCFGTALLVAGIFYVYTVTSLFLLLALFPAFAVPLYRRARFVPPVAYPLERSPREIWTEVRSPGAVMFTLLLFFQFGNEWSLAGWLTIYLVQTVGASPDNALLMLAGFWASLLLGRVAAQMLLKRVSHARLLFASAAAALLGCLIMEFTNNLFGAGVAIFLMGGGYSVIYPLVVEKIGHRFPHYHPGFYNGIFSIGLIGGLIAPGILGLLTHWYGIRAVMAVPTLGTITVFVLIVLLWIETKMTTVAVRRP